MDVMDVMYVMDIMDVMDVVDLSILHILLNKFQFISGSAVQSVGNAVHYSREV